MRVTLAATYALIGLVGAALIDARIAHTQVASVRRYTVPAVGWSLRLHELDASALAYVATRDLRANHRVRPEDLRRNPRLGQGIPLPRGAKDALVGKYVKATVGAGRPLTLDNIQAAPSLPATKGTVPMFFTLRDHDPFSELLDVGARVDVCRSTQCVLRDVPVFAIVCPSAAALPCSVGVEVPVADAPKASADDPKTPARVIPRGMGP